MKRHFQQEAHHQIR